jgi:hypothetical protein
MVLRLENHGHIQNFSLPQHEKKPERLISQHFDIRSFGIRFHRRRLAVSVDDILFARPNADAVRSASGKFFKWAVFCIRSDATDDVHRVVFHHHGKTEIEIFQLTVIAFLRLAK